MLTRWNPFRDVAELQNEINRVFSRAIDSDGNERNELTRATAAWSPAVDIYEDVEGVYARFDLAGIDPNEVDLKVDSGVFSIRGERKLINEEKKDFYYRIERSYGTFSRSFRLPDTVNVEKIRAESKHGVLSVFFPKRPETQPKQITVKVHDQN